MKKVMKDIFLNLKSNTYKVYMTSTIIYHFYLKELKLKKVKKFIANLHDKTEYVIYIKKLRQALDH